MNPVKSIRAIFSADSKKKPARALKKIEMYKPEYDEQGRLVKMIPVVRQS